MSENIAKHLDECHHDYIVSEIKQYLSCNKNLQGVVAYMAPENLSDKQGICIGWSAPTNKNTAKDWALKAVNILLKSIRCKDSIFSLVVATYYIPSDSMDTRHVSHAIYLKETTELKFPSNIPNLKDKIESLSKRLQ